MRRVTLIAMLLVFFLPAPSLATDVGGIIDTDTTWDHEIIANTVSDTNQVTSIALDSNGLPGISYYDLLADRFLRYAHKMNDGTWDYHTVDSNRNSGDYSSLQFNPSTGFPEISYFGNLYTGPAVLKFAQFDGISWNITSISPSGSDPYPSDTSLAYHPITNLPAIAYKHSNPSRVGLVEYNGTSWVGGEVPGSSVDKGLELKYLNNGNPVIAYRRDDSGLKYATRDTDWNITTVDNVVLQGYGDYQTVGLDFDQQGMPHIAYVGDGTLKYAFFNGTSWVVEDLERDCMRADLALDLHDNPLIAYQRGGDIYLGYRDGNSWIFVHIIGAAASMSNLLIDDSGRVHISYMKDYNLYYATTVKKRKAMPWIPLLFSD